MFEMRGGKIRRLISFLMELLVYPVIFYLIQRARLRREWRRSTGAPRTT